MAENINLTPEMRIDWNGLPFGTISGNVRITRDLVNKTDTEDTSSRIKASPLRRAIFQATAQRDPDQSYHQSPGLDIYSPAGGWLRIWANGRGDPTNVYDFPTVVLGEESLQWNMANSSAQEMQLNGESDGDFFLAGE